MEKMMPHALAGEEIWKDISGYEGVYQCSNLGRVRKLIFKNGMVNKKLDEPKIMKPGTGAGYKQVGLSKDRKIKSFLIHRLVLITFIGDPPSSKHVAAHLDGNKINNKLENLKWCTESENESHKHLHGTMPCGPRSLLAKLTMEQALEIKNLYKYDGKNKSNARDLAKKYGVEKSTVINIATGRRWNKALRGKP